MARIAGVWDRVQRCLFHVEESLAGRLDETQRQLVAVLEIVRVEEWVSPAWRQVRGRPRKDRVAMARAFVAKAVYGIGDTKALREHLRSDERLRRLCGWGRRGLVPSESTFSRAFGEFARSRLGDRVHEALVKHYLGEQVVWHVSRDSTAIEGREKPVEKPRRVAKVKRRPGRPKKGEVAEPAPKSRLPRQYEQTAEAALAELSVCCDVGTKIDSKGSKRHWVGYKLHADVGDGGLPLTVWTTAASVHDSQLAIPLSRLTAQRVTSWYDLMDAAYDATLIRRVSEELGHVPIIDPAKRSAAVAPLEPDRARRYRQRTSSERFNAELKDSYGGRTVRVRGHAKVHLHLMFGVLVIFALALERLL